MAVKKETVVLYLGMGISLLFVAYAAMKMDFRKAFEVILSANVLWLIPIVLLTFLTFYLRALRWWYILASTKKIPVIDILSALCIGFMANMLLPMRTGELIRAYVISKKERVGLSSVVGTVVLERVYDLLATIVLLIIVMFFARPANVSPEIWASLKKGGLTISGAFILAMTFMVMLVHNYTKVNAFLQMFYGMLPKGAAEKIESLLSAFRDGLRALEEGRHIIAITLYTAIIWIVIFMVNYSFLPMFDVDASLEVALVLSLFIIFGVMVPSSPGFVGPLHAGIVIALGLYGVDYDEALGIAIVIQLAIFVQLVAQGFFFLWYSGLSFSKIRQTAE
ncbi:MAG: lysylphosphatidylglycerol synthase transmembrane domain-containing protein [Nitrospinota bacterium]